MKLFSVDEALVKMTRAEKAKPYIDPDLKLIRKLVVHELAGRWMSDDGEIHYVTHKTNCNYSSQHYGVIYLG